MMVSALFTLDLPPGSGFAFGRDLGYMLGP